MAATSLLRLLLWSLCLFAIAQARLLQPVDVVSLPRPGSVSTSPSGKLAVYSQSTYCPEEDKVKTTKRIVCFCSQVTSSLTWICANRQHEACIWSTWTNPPLLSWQSHLLMSLKATHSSLTRRTLHIFRKKRMNRSTNFMSWILLQRRTRNPTSWLISRSNLPTSSELQDTEITASSSINPT